MDFKKIIIFLVLIASVIWGGKGIFKYSIFSTHDGDHHIARSFDVVETIKEGHFPLRWAGSLNYFCGVPVYNFYYPLLYYLVVLIDLLAGNVLLTLKIIYFLSLLVGTIFFYFWAKEETAKDIPALGGALLYLLAPYRFLLIFVRGSPEFLAYSILPIVLYLYARAFNSEGKKFILFAFLASFTGAILTISHNFTVMFLMPIILIYLIVKIILLKLDYKRALWLIFSFVSAFGMGSFFLGPALLEQKYTQIGGNFLMWRDHFPTFGQLITWPWGYFYSASGTANDGMSFMLGYAQWAILGLSGMFLGYQLIKSKFRVSVFLKENVWILLFFAGALFTLYLILPWSIPVWEKIKLLQEIQFSWRLLGIAVFTIATLFTFVLDKIKSKYLLAAVFLGITSLAFYSERNHLLPQPVSVQDVYRYDDFEKLHPHRYSTTTLGDEVLSKNAKSACWFDTPVLSTNKEEKISYEIVERKNTYGFVKALVDKKKIKGGKIVLALEYFPGIHNLSLNGKNIDYSDCGGLVCFETGRLRDGANLVSWKVGQSPVERFFNRITLLFLAVWGLLLILFLTKYRPKTWHFFLLAIFIIFAFLRFYNLDHRVGFSWDQERDAWAVKDILRGDIKFIGPRVLGPEGFFLPPYFYYILTPFYLLTGGHPYAVIYFLVVYGISFFLASFFIFRKLFGSKVALIFLGLWSINTSTVLMDKWPWNPTLIPISVVTLIYLLYLYDLKKSSFLLFLVGLLFGLGFSFHVQFLLLFPILLAFVKLEKKILSVAFGFVTSLAPIIIFDLKNNFLNTRLIVDIFTKGGQKNLAAFIPVFDRFFYGLSGIYDLKYISVAFYLIFLVIFYFISKKFKLTNFQAKLFRGFMFVWLAAPVFFGIYGSRPSEYYFNYLVPIMLLALAFLFAKLKPWVVIIFALLLIPPWIKRSYEYTTTNSLSVFYKDRAVRFLSLAMKKESKPFNVSFDVPLDEDAGFRYFLDYYKVAYTGNPKDPLIEFVIPPDRKKSSYPVGGIGVYIPEGFWKR